VPDAWATWFIGCLPQALLGMVITPILLYKLFPPEVRHSTLETPLQSRFPGAATEQEVPYCSFLGRSFSCIAM
jgi:di/tricarboxylate transporter